MSNILLSIITIGDDDYGFYHNTTDDSRSLQHETNGVVLSIDHSCNFTNSKGEHLGKLMSFQSTTWRFYDKDQNMAFDTGILVNDYHWKNLELAEIKTLEWYLTLFKEF